MISIVKDIKEANALTHGGTFHSDEVVATIILEKIYGHIKLCRVLKMPESVPKNVIVYDIGEGRFDHHQVGGNGIRKNGIPYASAGLVWREYGNKILRRIVPDEEKCSHAFRIIEKEIIQGVDAIDNGVLPNYDYPTQPLSLSRIVSIFNPIWNIEEDSDERFLEAANLVRIIFDRILQNSISVTKAQPIVERAIKRSKDGILILDKFMPWQGSLLSSTNPKAKWIKFVVYPSKRGGYGWQCVPRHVGSFEVRKTVPKEWLGLNGKELQDVTGVETATFCYKKGFMGGAETKEDAIKLVRLAIQAK